MGVRAGETGRGAAVFGDDCAAVGSRPHAVEARGRRAVAGESTAASPAAAVWGRPAGVAGAAALWRQPAVVAGAAVLWRQPAVVAGAAVLVALAGRLLPGRRRYCGGGPCVTRTMSSGRIHLANAAWTSFPPSAT